MKELMIETFLEAQEAPETQEDVDTYNQTVIDLGLEHLCIKENERGIEPMSDLERHVYSRLCPNKEDISKYNFPIPIRVLEAMKKAKLFLERMYPSDKVAFEVWTDRDPDPILIAKVGWREQFLIGRWGKELQDFPTLLKRAKDMNVPDIMKGIAQAKDYIALWEKDEEAFKMAMIQNKISTIYFN